MKASAVALGLISALAGAQSLEEGLARSLKLLLQLTGARAAGLVFFPRRGAPISVLEGTRGAPALDRWLRALLAPPPRAPGNPRWLRLPAGRAPAGPACSISPSALGPGLRAGSCSSPRRGAAGPSERRCPPRFSANSEALLSRSGARPSARFDSR